MTRATLAVTLGLAGLAYGQASNVLCWGSNGSGQCNVPDGVFIQVSAGSAHSLAIRVDGTVECWGWNRYGQCNAPSGVFTQVAGGLFHSIGLREDGTIACWGSNTSGQCDAPNGVFTQVAAGESTSIGLREDGTIACWGSNNSGQCDAPEGVFTQVSASGRHCLALREDGTIACWGSNFFGNVMHRTVCSRKYRLANVIHLACGKMAPLHAGDVIPAMNVLLCQVVRTHEWRQGEHRTRSAWEFKVMVHCAFGGLRVRLAVSLMCRMVDFRR